MGSGEGTDARRPDAHMTTGRRAPGPPTCYGPPLQVLLTGIFADRLAFCASTGSLKVISVDRLAFWALTGSLTVISADGLAFWALTGSLTAIFDECIRVWP